MNGYGHTAFALVRASRKGDGTRGIVHPVPLPSVPTQFNENGETAIGVAELSRLSGLPALIIEDLTERRLIHCLRIPGRGDFYFWSQVRGDLAAFERGPIRPKPITADKAAAAPSAA
jgi:hypothetical protein